MIASFTMDEAYFRECLGEWISGVSKGRKFQLPLCALFAFAGMGTLLLFPELGLAGCFCLAVAAFEAWRYVSFKRRWLTERLTSKQFRTRMSFELAAGCVKQLTPALPSTHLPALMRVVASRRGYFVYLNRGAFVYLPHASITPAASRDEVLRTLGAGRWSGSATGEGF
jgi:hypothetical protein